MTLDIIEICKSIRDDDDNNITPVIVLSSNRDKRAQNSYFE